jgi:hypothetical protein
MAIIRNQCETPTLRERQFLDLKTASGVGIRLLVVFPNMKKSIKSEEMQKLWTD